MVRYFRSDALIETRSYLTVYNYNSDDYSDAANKIIDLVYAARTPPASANKFKKRQGAKATKKLKQLESVGHELNPREVTSSRALSARCNYLAQDRPDIAYSAKEICREFAVPNKRSYEKLKRCAKYLAGQPRLVFKYPIQSKPIGISVYVDTDFAGCKDISGAVGKPGCGYRIPTYSKLLSNLIHQKCNAHKVTFQLLSDQD